MRPHVPSRIVSLLAAAVIIPVYSGYFRLSVLNILL